MKYVFYDSLAADPNSVEIDCDRYDSIKRDKHFCLVATGLEEKLLLLTLNLFEFEKELFALAEAKLLWQERSYAESMSDRLELDRRLVNVLTACRLYLDHSEHAISELFGNPSGELENVKEWRHQLYDAHLGYRIMEALRNHVQHSELPVHAISYQFARISGAGPDYFQHTVIPASEVKELRENESFKRAVLLEIESQRRIDLRGMTREYVSCLFELHGKIRDVITRYRSSARKLRAIGDRINKRSSATPRGD